MPPGRRRPLAAIITSDKESMRVAVPIANEPACVGWHLADAAHLGVLLVDIPMRILEPHALRDLEIDVGISLGLTLIVSAGLYRLLHQLVVKRIITFRGPLAAYAAGDFGVRLPSAEPFDEIGWLALTFNRLADQLERHVRDERARSDQSHQAILAERERIAGELHAALAQVLGLVQTKAAAIRLLLRRQQFQSAEAQLAQIEEAARGLFVDVREAILGLKIASQRDAHLRT